jgi:hypothetical protein
MIARLLIQFIAEILVKEIRVSMSASDDCKKLTRSEISDNLKAILKVKFKGIYNDVYS